MSATLQERIRDFDPSLPLERASTIPSSWYFDDEICKAEYQTVFANTWLTAGRVDQLREPGSFVTLELAGEPILIVRGEDGALRAFHNVCRHRAAQVINQPEGQVKQLRCRYHGWTYDLNGCLHGAPEFGGVADFRREDNGLVPLAVDTWGPLVFVHSGTPSQTLAEFLAPFPERTTSLGLEQFRFHQRRDYVLGCNWKVFVDNYQDGGYHVNTVHPGLSGALDYRNYRTEIAGNTSVQISPIRPADDTSVGKVRGGDHAYYWWIFPNLMVNLYQGVMDTNLVLPLGPDQCRVIFDFYFAETEGPEANKFIADSIAVAEQIQREDIDICAEVQRGLHSRSYDTGRFSVRREAGGYHFHRLLARKLRDGWNGV